MASSITEILNEIGAKYMSFDVIADTYAVDKDKPFNGQFSKVSIEYILFYAIAFCIWSLENLFYLHKKECGELLDSKKLHRAKWYRDKALAFQMGRDLLTDCDYYDNTAVSDETVNSERVVKYAAVIERDGNLFIKVAGETGGIRSELTAPQQTALESYFNNHVKDAGVRLTVINRPADSFKLLLTVFYDPMLLDSKGARLNGNDNEPVQNAVNSYIENLPFNGEYSNMALTDVLQRVEGVIIPEINASFYKYGLNDFIPIEAKVIPDSGYLRINNPQDLDITFIAYQTV